MKKFCINLKNGHTYWTDNEDAAEFIEGIVSGGLIDRPTTSDYEDLDDDAKEVVKDFCNWHNVYVGGLYNEFCLDDDLDAFKEAYEEYQDLYPDDDMTYVEYIKSWDYVTFEEYINKSETKI